MADHSAIEWTEATWNPVVGCAHVSPGCDHCYAAREASSRLRGVPVYAGLAVDGRFTGEVRCLPERLDQPLRWRRPRRIFVNSMSDLFHQDVSDEFIEAVLCTMNIARQHTYQVLTKRPQLMASLLARVSWDCNRDLSLGQYTAEELGLPGNRYYDVGHWLPHVWWGTSIESDRYAFRADHLRATPAAVRWLSLEPLLGPLPSLDLAGIDWVVTGGESGPGARPCNPDWVRDIRDRCVEAGVAYFHKQWGEWGPDIARPGSGQDVWDFHTGDGIVMRRFGKKAAGRLLDGRTWDEYPEPAGATS